ncbi:MAG: hypothetical protein KC731_13280 [Myxococcales bacterium]|nr:hypothetical protein [Myxococcales bacterium]
MRRRAALSLATLTVLVACGPKEIGPEVDADQLAALAKSFGELAGCLAPSFDGGAATKPVERMRRQELVVLLAGAAEGADAWPARCQPLVDETLKLAEGLKSPAVVERHRDLLARLRDVKGSSAGMLVAGEQPLVERLFAAAEAAGIPPSAAPLPPSSGSTQPASSAAPEAAPAPGFPVDRNLLRPLGDSKGFVERVDLAPGATQRFLLGEGDSALYCTFTSEAATFDHVRCASVSGSISVASRPLASEDDAKSYYFEPNPEPHVVEVGGESLAVPVSDSAFVFGEGTIVDVRDLRPLPKLIRRLPKGRVEQAPLKPPPGGTLLGFRAGTAVWQGPVRGASGRRPLTLEDAGGGRAPVKGKLDVGEIPPKSRTLLACRAVDRPTLLILEDAGGAGDDPEIGVALLRRGEKRWSKPVRSSVHLGKSPPPWLERGWWSFTCDAERAWLTWLRPDRRVAQLRCEGEACSETLSEPLPPFAATGASEKIRVGSIGDAAVVLRSLRGIGPVTGLTELVALRVAPVATLAAATDRIVIGDEEHGGLPDLHKSIGLLTGAEGAVLLIHSGPKIFGLRLDAQGAPAPLAEGGT